MKAIESLSLHAGHKTYRASSTTSFIELLKNSWPLKRLALNIGWGIANLFLLIYGSFAVIGTSLEIIWFIAVIIYAFCYWILAAKIFDILIGDEIDSLEKNR